MNNTYQFPPRFQLDLGIAGSQEVYNPKNFVELGRLYAKIMAQQMVQYGVKNATNYLRNAKEQLWETLQKQQVTNRFLSDQGIAHTMSVFDVFVPIELEEIKQKMLDNISQESHLPREL